jgi:hypothetical protein
MRALPIPRDAPVTQISVPSGIVCDSLQRVISGCLQEYGLDVPHDRILILLSPRRSHDRLSSLR